MSLYSTFSDTIRARHQTNRVDVRHGRLGDTLLGEHQWLDISTMHPDLGAELFTKQLLSYAEECIERRTITSSRATHPWMNQRAVDAVQAKLLAAQRGAADGA